MTRLSDLFRRLTHRNVGTAPARAFPDAFDRLARMVEAEQRRAGRRTLLHAR